MRAVSLLLLLFAVSAAVACGQEPSSADIIDYRILMTGTSEYSINGLNLSTRFNDLQKTGVEIKPVSDSVYSVYERSRKVSLLVGVGKDGTLSTIETVKNGVLYAGNNLLLRQGDPSSAIQNLGPNFKDDRGFLHIQLGDMDLGFYLWEERVKRFWMRAGL